MSLFQIVVVTLAACFVMGSIAATIKGWLSRREAVIWTTVWIVAGCAVALPNITGKVAKALGIGRGADLLLYCSVIVMIVGFLMIYARLRAVRRDLTLLVRRLAIVDALQAGTPNSASKPKSEPATP